jgi:hypothetical protein
MEPKDFSRFAGLSREEVARRVAAEDKETLDASLAPVRARIAREKREREAEQRRRIEAYKQAHHDKARRKLEQEKARRRELWMLDGGDPDIFEKQWPQMLSRIMEQMQEERQRHID